MRVQRLFQSTLSAFQKQARCVIKKPQILAGVLALALLLAVVAGATHAQEPGPEGEVRPQAILTGTAFTYQGELKAGDEPVTDNCQMAFRLYDDADAGSQVGNAITTTVPITDGLFTVVLNDSDQFGPNAFAGEARWLSIKVKCPGDAICADLGRQAVTAAPYALHAHSANSLSAPDGDPLRALFIDNDGEVGINLTAPEPGQRLHLGDGNFLIEGGGETAIIVKRNIVITGGHSGDSPNPVFQMGRVITAGDGDPEFRFLYSDDITPERSVFEFDRKGIVASVKTDRGSHFEGFISIADTEPIFRLNSYPAMRLEMGNGGSTPVDVAIQRETTSTLTLITDNAERLRVDSTGNVGIGTATPNSALEVDGYVQLDTLTSAPPAADCDEASERGRMKVDIVNSLLYICTNSGWVSK
jgi:hypothetical protein